jgi:hypothetical protein
LTVAFESHKFFTFELYDTFRRPHSILLDNVIVRLGNFQEHSSVTDEKDAVTWKNLQMVNKNDLSNNLGKLKVFSMGYIDHTPVTGT